MLKDDLHGAFPNLHIDPAAYKVMLFGFQQGAGFSVKLPVIYRCHHLPYVDHKCMGNRVFGRCNRDCPSIGVILLL